MTRDVQDIVDLASRLLDHSALLEDRDFHLVAFHSQRPDIDLVRQRSILERGSSAEVRSWFEQFGIATAEGPVRTPPDPSSGILGRLCFPVRWKGVTYGYLWVIDPDGSVSANPSIPEVAHLADEAGAVLAQRALGRLDVAILLEALLSPDLSRSQAAADELLERELVAVGEWVVVMEIRLEESRSAVPLNVWSLPREVLATIRPGRATLVIRLADQSDLTLLGRVATQAREHHESGPTASTERLLIGIGAPQSSVRAARTSHRQAVIGTRVARLRTGDAAVRWESLGPFRLLGSASEDDLAAALLDAPARRLLAHGDPELARTALVYLDEAGSIQRTTQRLGIHRQTAYYRLRRIAEITGLDLANGEDRLSLHLALKLAPVLSSPPPSRAQ